MKKIKDSHTLGIVSGILGGLSLLAFDQVSYKFGFSKRRYSQAASGMWVASKRQARSRDGNILGTGMTLGLCALGGTIFTVLLAKKGRDNLITKGAFYGITFGAITTALQSAFPGNKIKPKDATSNISYVLTNMIYGIVTTQAISNLGDDSVFPKPLTNQNHLDIQSDYNQNLRYGPELDSETNPRDNTIYFH